MWVKRKEGKQRVEVVARQVVIIIIATTTNIIIIIITRPKPAYGRQGLAGSWGQDTNQARIFWGTLNVPIHALGAQLGY